MLRIHLACVACVGFILAGCATATPVPLPNGGQGFVIDDCDSVTECYRKASATCGGGKYTLLGQGSETVPIVTSGAGTFTAMAIPQHSMTIECEEAATPAK